MLISDTTETRNRNYNLHCFTLETKIYRIT